jgi:hypothetical protein
MPGQFFSDDIQTRFSQLAARIQQTQLRSRYVDYRQAEADTHLLAAKIVEVYSCTSLNEFHFIAIPRGGFIVLGILSYILDLKRWQLEPPSDPLSPICIVDDCALTGARFADILQSIENQTIIFAHLYSHPELRKAIVEKEERVKHCFAAHDLQDSMRYQAMSLTEREEWRQRWEGRLQKQRYWLGQPELVSFAWSEPDYPFWNDVTEQIEDGWRFMPPHQCLKNWSRLGIPPRPPQPVELLANPNVVTGMFDQTIWLCHTQTEEVYGLEGVAADMWRAVVGYGNLDLAVAYLGQQYEVNESILRSDLEQFVQKLLQQDLLERVKP